MLESLEIPTYFSAMTELRRVCTEKLGEVLSKDTASSVEHAIYDIVRSEYSMDEPFLWDYIQVKTAYRNAFRRVYLNLKMEHCCLRQMILDASEAGHDSDAILSVIKGTHKSYAPDLWEEAQAEIQDDDEEEIVEQLESQVECGNCKRKKLYFRNVETEQKQTRSGDEGMTTFAYCRNCHRRWKF